MPEFTLHRNFLLRTTTGHSIESQKGVPVHVPPAAVEAAVSIGAVPSDPEDGDVLGEEEKAQPVLSPEERKAKVFEAFGIMKTRNERGDFTASNVPNNRRLPALLGFELTNRERDNYWREFQAINQEAVDQANLDAKVEREQKAAAAKKEDEAA